jgi:tetratricopeptide (TPR) repeat protein
LIDQISNRFDVLRGGPRDAPARQRTLRATIDWSYNLLGEDEQRLLARLAVFQGGYSLDAVRQVCDPDLGLDVMEGLESLVDKSLVQLGEGSQGEPRAFSLETIRAYTSEKLEQFQEITLLHHRHAAYFLALAEQAEPHLMGGPLWARWISRMEAEHGNLSAALEWTLSGGDAELGVRLVGSLNWYWHRQGYYGEWQGWVRRALEKEEIISSAARARLLMAAGSLAYALQDLRSGKAPLEQALAIFRAQGNRIHLAMALIWRCVISVGQPAEFQEAVACGEEALAIFQELGSQPGMAQAFNAMGEVLLVGGDFARARAVYQDSLALAREIGDEMREQMMNTNLGFIAQHEGDLELARAHFMAGLTLAQKLNHKVLMIHSLAAVAGLAVGLQQARRAARLMGAVEYLMESTGFVLQPSDQTIYDRQKNRWKPCCPRRRLRPPRLKDA